MSRWKRCGCHARMPRSSARRSDSAPLCTPGLAVPSALAQPPPAARPAGAPDACLQRPADCAGSDRQPAHITDSNLRGVAGGVVLAPTCRHQSGRQGPSAQEPALPLPLWAGDRRRLHAPSGAAPRACCMHGATVLAKAVHSTAGCPGPCSLPRLCTAPAAPAPCSLPARPRARTCDALAAPHVHNRHDQAADPQQPGHPGKGRRLQRRDARHHSRRRVW